MIRSREQYALELAAANVRADRAESNFGNAQGYADELRDWLGKERTAREHWAAEAAHLRSRVAELERLARHAEHAAQSAEHERDSAHTERDVAESRVAELEKQRNAGEAAFVACEQARVVAEARVLEMDEPTGHADYIEIVRLRSRVAELEAELRQCQTRRLYAQTGQREAEARVSELERAFDAQHFEALRAAEARVAQLEAENSRLRADADKIEELAAKLSVEERCNMIHVAEKHRAEARVADLEERIRRAVEKLEPICTLGAAAAALGTLRG